MKTAEDYLHEILERNKEIERLQEEINELAEEAKDYSGYDFYQESIESYITS